MRAELQAHINTSVLLYHINILFRQPGSGGPVVERLLKDRRVPGSSRSQAANFLEQEIKPALLLSTQVYKWVHVRNISQCSVAAYGADC